MLLSIIINTLAYVSGFSILISGFISALEIKMWSTPKVSVITKSALRFSSPGSEQRASICPIN